MKRAAEMIVLLGTLCLASPVLAEEWTFEDAEPGKLPAGWTAAKTGSGPGSVWCVEQEASAPAGARVLVQTSSEGPKPLFNLCVADKSSLVDLDLSVALKAVRGKIDQGGGPVWRYRDENHYYIARVNPLEWNFRLYKVVAGKRTQLATADVEPPDGVDEDAWAKAWHTIRVVHKGDKIACYLDGKLLLEAADGTFAGVGKVGLWTKADAVTAFDQLTVTPPND